MELKEPELPVLGQDAHHEADAAAEDGPSCGPKVYVSNEEAALLNAMRGLRERGLELRRCLAAESDPERRSVLERELEALRQERDQLAARREQAFLRKMVMLGHLPPQALDEPVLL